jgi:mono/diheme cytochrome c family protein
MTRTWIRPALALGFVVGIAGAAGAAEPFEDFIQKHCIRCHGPEKEKGDLRVVSLMLWKSAFLSEARA